ncbi:MAG: tetratricopeptide repeat protein [Candidatus Thorarchaeota archaeon]
MKLGKIRALISEGKFDKALQFAEIFEKNQQLSSQDNLACKLLKGQILVKVGQYEDGLQLAQEVLIEGKTHENCLFGVDAQNIIAEALWHLGRYDKALTAVSEGESILGTLDQDRPSEILPRKANLMYQKGRSLWRKGELGQALQCYHASLTICGQIGNKQEIADALNSIGIIHAQKGELEESWKYFQQSLELRLDLGNKDDIAGSYYNIGSSHHHKGELDQALDYYQQSLVLWKEIGNKQHIARSLANIGSVFREKGMLKQALDYSEQCLSIREEIGNKQDLAISLNNIGVIYRERGNLDQSLAYFERALALAKEIGNEQHIAAVLNNIGRTFAEKGNLSQALEYHQQSRSIREKTGSRQDYGQSLTYIGAIYYSKGELERALKYYQQSLAVHEEIGDKPTIASQLASIGVVYHQKGDLEQAIKLLEESLALCEEIGNHLRTAVTLFALISSFLDHGSLASAQSSLKRLQQINEQEQNKRISQYTRVAEALILKTTGRLRNRAKAEELFEQVVKEEIASHELTVTALLNLCELELGELRISADYGELDEVKTYVARLLEIAEEQQSHWLLAETLLLKAKLALLELDVNSARRFLTRAQQIADEWDLRLLAMKVSSEHDALLNQLNLWETLVQRNASLPERLEIVQLEKLIGSMIRRRTIDDSQVPPEDPVMLLILSENGLCIFSKLFFSRPQVEDQLVAAFLTAITKLGTSIFEESERVDRIVYQEHILALKPLGALIFCYAFKGQSYNALRKLDRLTSTIQGSTVAWSGLNRVVKTSQTLKRVEKAKIEEVVNKIILGPTDNL